MTTKVSNYFEINYLKELDKYIPCRPIMIEHGVKNNLYNEKIFTIINNINRGVNINGLVLDKKMFNLFGYDYVFEYYEIALEEGNDLISEKHVRCIEHCRNWYRYIHNGYCRIKGYYFTVL